MYALIANAITRNRGVQRIKISALPTISITCFTRNREICALSGLNRSGYKDGLLGRPGLS